MDKVKLLMDKYGLPEYTAVYTCSLLSIEKAEKIIRTVKKNNLVDFQKIEKAAEWKGKNKIDYSFTQKDTSEVHHDIHKIKFWINEGEQITIDDPYILDQFANFILKNRFTDTPYRFTSPKKRGNQIKNNVLRSLALDLWDYCEGTSYERRAIIGRIFAEFLPEYIKCLDSTEHLQKKINNLFPGILESDWERMLSERREVYAYFDKKATDK
jgi:hypothetical protein